MYWFRRAAGVSPHLDALAILALVAAGCGRGSTGSPAPPLPVARTFRSGGIYPEGIGIDKSDNVWIANRYSNSVVELSPQGVPLRTISVGTRPHGLKIDRANTGNIWVENTASNDVTAIGPDGTVINSYSTQGLEPQHAQFDSSGDIWVTNQGSNTVARLKGDGTFVQTYPTGKNPHAISRDQAGNFWIGNYSDGTVTVLDSNGGFVHTIAGVGYQPTGNDAGPSGNLWQAVQSLDQVAVFAAAPSFAKINDYGVGVAPRGVTIDKAGNVFIANQRTNNVLKLNSSGIKLAEYKVGACPENMAVDSKGGLWVTNACGNNVTEIKGVATPDPAGDEDSNG